MAGHRKEPCVYIALLADTNPVNGCLHVVIDATPRNTLKHPKAMPVGIEQHLMRLQLSAHSMSLPLTYSGLLSTRIVCD